MFSLIEPPPTRFDLTFRLFGTPVRVSAWFWVFPSIVGGLALQFFGVPYLFLVFACYFLSVLVHEFGHVFSGRRFGKDSYVVLNAIGGMAFGCAEMPKYWQRLIVFASGPAIQVIFAGILWAADELVIRPFTSMELNFPVLHDALIGLMFINLGLACFNLIPLGPPLDGWQICREIYLRVSTRAVRSSWESDPDAWKRGVRRSDYHRSAVIDERDPKDNRLPVMIMLGMAAVLVALSELRDYEISTATDLMREFKKDPRRAMEWYGHRKVAFRAVLKRPPWEKAIFQYGGGKEALVYFVTDGANEWLFCTVPYRDALRELREGREYNVTGEIYHFEDSGKLFLSHCSIRLAGDPARIR